MEVRALVRFRDLKERKIREIGEVFPCTEERYQEILENGNYVELVEEPEEEAPDDGEAAEADSDDGEAAETDSNDGETPEEKGTKKTRRKNKKEVG